MTITFLTGSTIGKTAVLMEMKMKSNYMQRWSSLILILLGFFSYHICSFYTSKSQNSCSSFTPRIKVAGRKVYSHFFAALLFDLKKKLFFLYVITFCLNDLFYSFLLRNSKAARTTVSCVPTQDEMWWSLNFSSCAIFQFYNFGLWLYIKLMTFTSASAALCVLW